MFMDSSLSCGCMCSVPWLRVHRQAWRIGENIPFLSCVLTATFGGAREDRWKKCDMLC